MIVQCDSCQAKYRIKDEKISDKGAKVKCSKCKNYFVVRKDQAPVEAPAEAPAPAVEAPAAAPPSSEDDGGFGIDFEPEAPAVEAPAPPPVEAPAPPAVEAPAPPAVEAPPPVEAPAAPAQVPTELGNETTSLGEASIGTEEPAAPDTTPDTTNDADDGGWSAPDESSAPITSNEAGEDDSWGSGEDSWDSPSAEETPSTEGESPSFGQEEEGGEASGFGGFGFEEETSVGSDTTSQSASDDGPSFGGFGGGGGFEVEVDGDNSSGGDETVIFSVGGAGAEDSGMGLATSSGEGAGEETVFGGFGMSDDDDAETQVEEEGAPEPQDSAEEEGGKKEKKKKKKKEKKERSSHGGGKPKRLLAVLLILIVIGGGGYAYTQGMLDTVLDPILGSILKPSVPDEEAIEIIALKGVFVENENFGSVFSLEGKIRNNTEDDQRIEVVKGTIYDKNGKALKYRKVSPGRIISRGQLKTLSKEDINRRFKDVSGGKISPLGTLPVMIVFMEIPPDMVEAGIEVVR